MNEPLNKKDFLTMVDAVIEQLMSRRELSVINVADALGIQTQRMQRLLKSTLGLSASQYLSNYRLKRAKDMLLEHDMLTIAKIGYVCGFEEPTHFTRFFKRMTGMTPSEFIDKNQPH